MKAVFAALVGLGLAGMAQAESPALYDVTGVAAGDVLNLRAESSATSAIVGSLARNARGVEVVAITADGKWGVVNTAETSAYVALRFLARQTNVPWYALQTPLTCLGTEPFWSLAFDPAKPSAMYSTPEGDEAFANATRWPGNEWPRSAALGFAEDRFAVLDSVQCSDGMSDRRYGIRVSLFLTGSDGPTTLQGCCTLQP